MENSSSLKPKELFGWSLREFQVLLVLLKKPLRSQRDIMKEIGQFDSKPPSPGEIDYALGSLKGLVSWEPTVGHYVTKDGKFEFMRKAANLANSIALEFTDPLTPLGEEGKRYMPILKDVFNTLINNPKRKAFVDRLLQLGGIGKNEREKLEINLD